jgi:hypothetical protein
MAASREHDHGKKAPRHLHPTGSSQDRKRDDEETRHHPATHTVPHPPHHPQYQVTGSARHHPHTQPGEQVLNTDHGTHEDRPRPGKIAKKSKRPSA